MKKHLSIALCLLVIAVGCQRNDKQKTDVSSEGETSSISITKRSCGSYEVLQQQLKADPSLRNRMEQIEAFTRKMVTNPSALRLVNGVLTIPVVVNVVYNTAAQNISNAQIQSQIAVLNKDYTNTNSDKTMVPSEFQPVDGTIGIQFVLDTIIRKKTTKTSWSTNDAVKKSSLGGVNPTSPTTKLNMWACNLGQGLLGYAQFPGGSSATDGVVILYSAFGSRDVYPSGTYISTYDKGRTATHEIGHWMNLRHIWGDATCGDDMVNDTPVAAGANYGCPGLINSTCGVAHHEMSMNYMDYTDDACMYMFTNGQKSRVLATFASGGPRYAFNQ